MNNSFVNKYRPKSLDDFLWPTDEAEDEVRTYADLKRHGHIFLYGPPGTGKTLLSELLPAAIYSGEEPWEQIRPAILRKFDAYTAADRTNMVASFESSVKHATIGFDGDRRFAIINEIDDLVTTQVSLLKNVLDWVEEISRKGHRPVMLITTANTLKVPPAVRDRMNTIQIPSPSKTLLIDYGRRIAAEEKVVLDADTLRTCAERAAGSVRGMLRELEGAVFRIRLRQKRGASKAAA